MISRILLGLGSALLASTAFAQTSASATANATTTIYVPIAVTKTADLVFGDVFPGTAAGTVTVDPAGAAPTFTGAGVSLGTAHPSSHATYTLTGQTSASFSLALPASIVMKGPGTPATDITVTAFTASVGGGVTTAGPSITAALTAGGTQTLAVGATMGIAKSSTQTAGAYSGTYSITVTYN